MILAVNYANEKYKVAQKFNSKRALKYGADKVIEYSENDLDEEYKKKNNHILQYKRGGGYWIWKPYILKDALEKVNEGDYVVYTDAGSAFVDRIQYLIDKMENDNTDIMVFSITHVEKEYTKRDAFVIMGCDYEKYTDTLQICSGYIILKKTTHAIKFVEDYLRYIQDARVVTDEPNVMGKPNYEGFVEHRHDQSILSLLSKKYNIKPYRDPSQWGLEVDEFTDEIIERSGYPQIIDSHRNSKAFSRFQLRYKTWYKYFDVFWYKEIIKRLVGI